MSEKADDSLLLNLTAQIVSALVSHNPIAADALSPLVASVIKALFRANTEAKAASRGSAVPIDKSVFADHIVCLECGAAFKTLKRHLATDHSLSSEAYREKWGLSHSYPFVAAEYATRRSALAKQIGLGRKPRARRSGPREAQVGKRGRAKRGA